MEQQIECREFLIAPFLTGIINVTCDMTDFPTGGSQIENKIISYHPCESINYFPLAMEPHTLPIYIVASMKEDIYMKKLLLASLRWESFS